VLAAAKTPVVWPVKPTKRTLPCCFAFCRASAAPPGRNEKLRIILKNYTVNLPEVEVIGLQRRTDCSSVGLHPRSLLAPHDR